MAELKLSTTLLSLNFFISQHFYSELKGWCVLSFIHLWSTRVPAESTNVPKYPLDHRVWASASCSTRTIAVLPMAFSDRFTCKLAFFIIYCTVPTETRTRKILLPSFSSFANLYFFLYPSYVCIFVCHSYHYGFPSIRSFFWKPRKLQITIEHKIKNMI